MLKGLAKRALQGVMPRRAYCALRRYHERYVNSRRPPRRVQHRYCGHDLVIDLGNSIAESWYDADWEELPELTVLGAHALQAGARVFDIGAHHCVVAMIFAKIVGSNGKVVAVEPST